MSGGQASAANGDRAYAGAAASRYGHYTTGAWNGDLAHIGAAPPDTEPPEPLPEPPPVPEVTGVSPDHGSTDGGEHADVYGAVRAAVVRAHPGHFRHRRRFRQGHRRTRLRPPGWRS